MLNDVRILTNQQKELQTWEGKQNNAPRIMKNQVGIDPLRNLPTRQAFLKSSKNAELRLDFDDELVLVDGSMKILLNRILQALKLHELLLDQWCYTEAFLPNLQLSSGSLSNICMHVLSLPWRENKDLIS